MILSILSILALGAGICHLLMALLLVWNRWRTPTLPVLAVRAPAPRVVAVVPARNEEANIGPCVRSLLAQDYPALRVRVVDDHSTDRTAERVRDLAAADARLELLQAPALPPGWLGKPHALWCGTRGQDPDYFLFVDADMRLAPDALGRAVAAAEQNGAALLTVVPRLLAESFWERAIQPVVASLLFSLLDPVKVNDPGSRVASANGPLLLFSREGYQRIGGHAAVAGEVVEDLRLAQAVKAAGLRLCYLHAIGAARLRMYDSLGGIVAGWSKNFHVALGRARWLAPLLSVLIAWVYAWPTVCLGLALHLLATGAQGPVALLLAVYGADWLGRLSLSWNYGITPRGVRALGGLVVAGILCNSVYRAAFGRPVRWRGRDCPAVPPTGPRQGGCGSAGAC
ncbi:MAG: glycosyltransferase [Myxococcales bacterium]|nr:glycosyltransferase [Myxococcota bacterium]MDW8283264.1 glycosyltransferase [Myxococcales bacterium]